MNRRQPLILVDNPELVASGLWPDRHPAQTPLWEAAANVQFAGGKVQRRVPNSIIPVNVVFDPGRHNTTGIGQLQASDGVRWLYFNVLGALFRWYGPAAEFLGGFEAYNLDQTSVADATVIDFTPWGNWMLANGIGNLLYKPEVPSLLPLAGAPSDAVAFFKKRNQLLAVGHGVNKRLVSFSDADNIEGAPAWTDAPDNLAGTIPIEELNTPTRAACHFGTSLAVFGENQMFEVKWVGAPFYYGQNKLLDGIGAVGKGAVCSDGSLVYGMSRNGAWKTDGMQYSYIDEVVLRDYFQARINWAQRSKIMVRKNDLTGCIEFSFPALTSLECNETWAYDPRYGGWSPVPAFTAMAGRALFDKPVQAIYDPVTQKPVIQLVADNPALDGPQTLETKAMLVQRDNQQLHVGALIDEIELFLHATDKVEFQYGVAEFPDGPWIWTDPIETQTHQITYKLDTKVSGTYHKLKFKNFGVNWSFDLQGFALFGSMEGQKRDKA